MSLFDIHGVLLWMRDSRIPCRAKLKHMNLREFRGSRKTVPFFERFSKVNRAVRLYNGVEKLAYLDIMIRASDFPLLRLHLSPNVKIKKSLRKNYPKPIGWKVDKVKLA